MRLLSADATYRPTRRSTVTMPPAGLIVSVQKPGRYEMALLAGGEEIGRQPLLIGHASALTRSDFD